MTIGRQVSPKELDRHRQGGFCMNNQIIIADFFQYHHLAVEPDQLASFLEKGPFFP